MTFDLDSYFSILVLLLVSSVKFPFYFLELMAMLNPLKPSVILPLHFERSTPYRPKLRFIISDIRALWRSVLSTRVPECRKL